MSAYTKAKFYVYRNLNDGTKFSVKQRGIVQGYIEVAKIPIGAFKVSDAGRVRCLRERKRNVHAFITTSQYPMLWPRGWLPPKESLREVKYNPYVAEGFFFADNGDPVTEAENIYLFDGRCFVEHK
jgi:hypothetical protein